jgi:hypothetical protein
MIQPSIQQYFSPYSGIAKTAHDDFRQFRVARGGIAHGMQGGQGTAEIMEGLRIGISGNQGPGRFKVGGNTDNGPRSLELSGQTGQKFPGGPGIQSHHGHAVRYEK